MSNLIRFQSGSGWIIGRLTMLSLAVIFPLVVNADIVVLENGREYEGVLLRADAEKLIFRQNGAEVAYDRADVVHVRLQKRREWDAFNHVDEIPDDKLQNAMAARISPRKYPGAGTYTLLDSTSIVLQSPRTWRRTHRFLKQILHEHGADATVQSLTYRADADEVTVKHGISIRTDGSVVHLRDTAIQDESIYSNSPRYNILCKRRFALPEGTPGVVLDGQTEVVRKKALNDFYFYDEFLFGALDPIRRKRVEIHVPEKFDIKWQILNDPAGHVSHSSKQYGDGTVHTWVREHTPNLIPEPQMPPLAAVVPRLVVSADPRSWKEIAADYEAGLTRQLVAVQVPEVPARGVTALWNYVSGRIQAQGIPVAASGYLPGSPRKTHKLRGGAPVDRAFLFYAWLQEEEEVSENIGWGWVRSRKRGKPAPDVPCIQAFDIPVVTRSKAQNNEMKLLMLGDELDAFGEPLRRYGGCAYLTPAGSLESLPIPEPEQDRTEHRVKVTWNEAGEGMVREKLSFFGSSARSLRAWRRLTREEIRNRVEGIVSDSVPRAQSIKFEVSGDVQKNGVPLHLHLSYSAPRLVDAGRKLASFQAPWLEYTASLSGRDKRRFPVLWKRPHKSSTVVEITSPAVFKMASLPPPTDIAGEGLQIGVRTTEKKDTVTLQVKYQRDVLELAADKYQHLKRVLEKRASLGRQYWVWER